VEHGREVSKNVREFLRTAYRLTLEVLEDRLAPATLSPLQVSGNGRFLVDGGGTPFLMRGDAAWSLIAATTGAEADQYLADRQARGFNLVLVNLIEHLFAPNAPADNAGDFPFFDPATGSHRAFIDPPNPRYFAYADQVINDAAQRGLYVLLDPSYLGFPGTQEGWSQEIAAAGPAAMRQWGQFVGNHYKDFPNIVWLQGADYNPPADLLEDVNQVALGIRDAGDTHLMSVHPQSSAGPTSSQDVFGSYPWVAFNGVYTWNGASSLYQKTLAEYNRTNHQPTYLLEERYEGNNGTVRQYDWMSMMAGTFGGITGNENIWPFDADPLFGRSSWQGALDSPGARAMTNLTQFRATRAWYNTIPDQGHTVIAGSTPAVYNPDGSLAVAYLMNGGSATVNLARFNGGVTARWFDPANGTYQAIAGSPLTNAGITSFTAPGANGGGGADWVLVLETGATPTPPAAPSNPVATAVSTSQINLSWTDNSSDETGFKIDRATDAGFTRNVVFATVGANVTGFQASGLAPGTTYFFRIRSTNATGDSVNSSTASAATPAAVEGPFGGTPEAIPGKIEAENFDTGGEGVAFHDVDTANLGGAYRPSEAVDIQATTDTGDGFNVGWIRAGEWLKYTVTVTTAGAYDLALRVSNTGSGGKLHVEVDGVNVTGRLKVPNTGGWQTWTTITKTGINLTAGQHVMKVSFDTNAGSGAVTNLNWLSFTTSTPPAPATPTGPTATAGDGQIALTWNAVSGATSYNVYRSTTGGGEGGTPFRTGVSGTAFTDTGLTNGTQYFYRVSAVNGGGESGSSTEASATSQAAATLVRAINAGGGAAGSFEGDASVTGGSTFQNNDVINTSGVANPAPAAMYDSERFGNFTYTISGLTPRAAYTVRLHFAEIWWTSAGSRLFNVKMNDTQVLTDFDIFAAAGGKDIAIARDFTAFAGASGTLTIQFITVTDNAKVSGIEIFAP
jgi:hypothetical protein